ncbi:hypothetical protein ACC696_33670, partial [Rhizobium ruizarguesonis]
PNPSNQKRIMQIPHSKCRASGFVQSDFNGLRGKAESTPQHVESGCELQSQRQPNVAAQQQGPPSPAGLRSALH